MMPSNNNKSLLTAAAAALTASYALYRLYDAKTKRDQQQKALAPAISTPLNDDKRSTAVSHVHLQVEDLSKSKQFYLDFGFVTVESEEECDDSTNMVLLKVPGAVTAAAAVGKQPPYLLLEENKQRIRRTGHAAAVGYARMCLLVEDCDKESRRLAEIENTPFGAGGYQPIAPAVTDRPGNPNENNPYVTILAYEDPDGNMVELVSLTGPMAFVLKATKLTGVVQFPLWVHVNINVTSYEKSWKAYQSLGFVMGTNYKKVENTLYRALGIPDPGIAKQVSLIKFPKKDFVVDLIEWENPKTETPEVTGSTMRLALAVDDVCLKLDELLLSSSDALWSLEAAPTCVDLPPPLNGAVKCTVKDPDGVLVDLLSYPETSILLEENSKVVRESLLADSNNKKKARAVLVTGCDSGFGRSVAVQMAELGYKVIAACFTNDGAKFLDSIATTTVVADLTTDKGLKDVVDAVHSTVNDGTELWAIVNNAGMHMPGHVEWTPPETYKRVMALNFHAPVYLIHEFLPMLRESKGRIVNVTSVCGMVSAPSNSTYSSSKFALEALSDALRVENKPFGINVVVVEPTTMRTPLAFDWYKSWEANFRAADPQKRTMHSDEWAEGLIKTGSAFLEAAAEDPRITVGEIVNALVMKDPPARILSGVGALGYYELSRLPESVHDKIYHIGPDL